MTGLRNHLGSSPFLRHRSIWGVLILAAYFLLTLLGIESARGTDRTAAVWLPSSLILASAIGAKPRVAGLLFLGSVAAYLGVGLVISGSATMIVGFCLANLVEISICYTLLRYFCGETFDVSRPSHLSILMVVGGLAAPTISAVLAMATYAVIGEQNLLSRWFDWASARSLGMLLGFPVFLLIFRGMRTSYRPSREKVLDWLGVFALGIPVLGTIFLQTQYPLLFGASLFVLLAAFRLGTPGAVVATLLTGLAATAATVHDLGPIATMRQTSIDEIHVLQLFLLCTFLGSLPIAANLASRNRLQAEVEGGRHFVESILNGIHDVAFKTDAQGRWTYLNSAWEGLTGYSVRESLGNLSSELLAPEFKVSAAVDYGPLREGEVNELHLQQQFVHADGSLKWVESKIVAIRGPSNELIGTTGTIRDVTDARIAQIAWERSERRFRTLTDLSPAGIFSTDAEGQLNYANSSWLNFSGLTEEQARGDGWVEAIHPADLDRVHSEWANAVARKTSLRMQFRFARKDGSQVWVVAYTSPELDANGDLVGHIGVVVDITENVRIREDLANERERFKYLTDNATDAIVAIGVDGRCHYASPAIFEVSGVHPDEVIGEPISLPVDEEGQKFIEEAYARLFSGESDREVIIYKINHKTRGWLWNESHVRLIRGDYGEPLETIASVRDVTEKVALEQELIDAKNTAEGAAKAKSTFLANMSHEIRTPMNGVVGFADLLSQTALTDDQRRYVELIQESGNSLVALINDILDISKIEAGQMTISEEPIDPVHTINGTIKLMRAAAEKKSIDLIADHDIDEALIWGDKLRIRQILSNIIGNAIKFTETGSVKVQSKKVEAEGKNVLKIAISDTGRGISPARLSGIFEEFEQEDDSTVRRYGGTGLGLTISRNLARVMGGDIDVTSEVGNGSCFTISFPYRSAERREVLGGEPKCDLKSKEPSIEVDKRRILVAEDNDINQALISAMLDKTSFAHDVAENGLIALEMVKAAEAEGQPYSLILMDIQMPEMDGFQTTRAIREHGIDAERLPIVALTANAFDSDVQQCLDAGMQAHISKPIQYAKLRVEIGRWLPLRRLSDADETVVKMANLDERFASFVAEVAMKATALLDQLPTPNRLDMVEMRVLSHNLSGTAGMFGYPKIGQAAAACEEILEKALETGIDRQLGNGLNKLLIALDLRDEEASHALVR